MSTNNPDSELQTSSAELDQVLVELDARVRHAVDQKLATQNTVPSEAQRKPMYKNGQRATPVAPKTEGVIAKPHTSPQMPTPQVPERRDDIVTPPTQLRGIAKRLIAWIVRLWKSLVPSKR